MLSHLFNNNLVTRKNILLFQRYLFTSPPSVSEILHFGKVEKQKAISNRISVDKNTNCLKCYEIMKNYNINYIKITDNKKIIGIINIADVRTAKIWYEYEIEKKST